MPLSTADFAPLDYGAVSDEPDAARCERWTREHGMVAVPVSVLQAEPPPEQRLLRSCFARSDDVLEEAAKRLCAI